MSRRRKDDGADLATVALIAFCFAVALALIVKGPGV